MASESAMVGMPPNTEKDALIVKGLFYIMGILSKDIDESLGYFIIPPKPEGFVSETKGPAILGVMAMIIIIQIAVTVTRLGLRKFLTRMAWGWDDWVIIPGLLLAVGAQIIVILMVRIGGGGKHIYEVSYVEFNYFLMLSSIYAIFVYTAFGVIKISIALLNLRLTAVASQRWVWVNRAFLGILVAYTLLAIFWIIFGCTPVPYLFDREYAGRLTTPPKCQNTQTLVWVLSVTHTVMDFLLLMTPVWVILKVKMSRGNRIRLILLFSLGAASCATSIGRIKAMNEVSFDLTWQFTTLLAWNTTDLTMSIIVASLPVFNVLFSRGGGSGQHQDGPSDLSFSLPTIQTVPGEGRGDAEKGAVETTEVVQNGHA